MNDESASVFFHALKYSKSLQNLRIENAKFSAEGFQQLANCVQSCRSLQTLALVDLDNLGASVLLWVRDCRRITRWNSVRTSPRLCSPSAKVSP